MMSAIFLCCLLKWIESNDFYQVMKSKMITEVQITPVKAKDGLVAFASVVLDGKFYLGSIAVHQKLDGSGLRLTYPTRRVADRDFHIFHPIKREASFEFEEAIFSKFKEVMTQTYDRYS